MGFSGVHFRRFLAGSAVDSTAAAGKAALVLQGFSTAGEAAWPWVQLAVVAVLEYWALEFAWAFDCCCFAAERALPGGLVQGTQSGCSSALKLGLRPMGDQARRALGMHANLRVPIPGTNK